MQIDDFIREMLEHTSSSMRSSLRSDLELCKSELEHVSVDDIPVVPDLDKKMAEVALQPGALDMDAWHTCDTTHCRAGWAITLAGAEGKNLEDRVGPLLAGAMIYHKSAGYVPDFYAGDEDATEDIRKRAELAQAAITSSE